MLTTLSSEARLTETGVSIDIISAETIVLTRIAGTVVNVDIAVGAGPAWLTDTLVSEQLVNTLPSDTGVWGAQVHLLLASLACEALGTVTAEVIDQVSAISPQQTGLLQTVVNVVLAVSPLPTLSALTGVSPLRQGSARGAIATRIAILRAGVCGDITVLALKAISTQALIVVGSGKIFAHCSVWAGALHAV